MTERVTRRAQPNRPGEDHRDDGNDKDVLDIYNLKTASYYIVKCKDEIRGFIRKAANLKTDILREKNKTDVKDIRFVGLQHKHNVLSKYFSYLVYG